VKLTLHFDLDEFTISQIAVRLGIRNDPPPAIVENLRKLARILEDVRAILGGAILISSGYRSPELNEAVKGSKASAHIRGLAADFTAPTFGTPRECALAIMRSHVEFDQLIVEGGRWVHLGLSEGDQRKEVLTATFGPLGTSYSRGIA